MRKPASPRALLENMPHVTFSSAIAGLRAQLAASRSRMADASEAAATAASLAAVAVHRRHIGDVSGAHAAHADALHAFDLARGSWSDDAAPDSPDAAGPLARAACALVTADVFHLFLESGSLGRRPATALDDESWLSGMVGAAHEIGRYAANRATCGDTRSVEAAADVVSALHDALALFDFRNGNLRRSFDSLKYVERRLEDTKYELSLFPPKGHGGAEMTTAHDGQTPLGEPDASYPLLLDTPALEAARESYAAFDLLREAAIKKCREPQKSAKQAISALHRGDADHAAALLASAATIAADVVAGECAQAPALRHQGFVSGMLEELAEAMLFQAWMHDGELLPFEDTTLLGGVLLPSEYLGGCCDLVGEIGRYAVRRATERDAEAVRKSLASAIAIHSAMLSMAGLLPRGIAKKSDPLKQAIRKLETLLYELSLVERSGRTQREPSEWPSEPLPMSEN
ncbi:hypothetical protein AB1Y20_021729 [Prymnesium parvum]|uniref:Translin n=1 Tax=Prymnesium parvum TaxID=97485 RepID=A0AB34JL25_PRYPA